MKRITTLDHRIRQTEPYSIDRYAARAVILYGHQILLIKLMKTNEYKFPGGGIEKNETNIEALIRETQEEAGVEIKSIDLDIGYIDQVYPDKYDAKKLFSMRSYYYLTQILDGKVCQRLSNYEQNLGFNPVWVDIDEAIKTNVNRIQMGSQHRWTERECFMLKYVKNKLVK